MTKEMNLDQMTELIHWYKEHSGTKILISIDASATREPQKWVRDIVLLSQMQVDIILVLGASFGTSNPGVVSKQDIESEQQHWFKEFSSIRQAICSGEFGSELDIIEGSFITAKPKGVVNGVDSGFAGSIKNVYIDEQVINRSDGRSKLLCLSPFAYAQSGSCLLLDQEELCQHISNALEIQKLVFISQSSLDIRSVVKGELATQVSYDELSDLVSGNHSQNTVPQSNVPTLAKLSNIFSNTMIQRIHWVSAFPSALMQELYTQQGAGILLHAPRDEQIRQATLNDLGDILQILKPEERKGNLVKRDREKLEDEIGSFYVVESDIGVVACAALVETVIPVEIAAVCTRVDAQNKGYGSLLLAFMQELAKERGHQRVVVLTTQAEEWFARRGYTSGNVDILDMAKQEQYYNLQRQSKVMIKQL